MDISHSIRLLGEGSTTFTYTKGAAYNISQETRKPIMNSATIILFFGLVLALVLLPAPPTAPESTNSEWLSGSNWQPHLPSTKWPPRFLRFKMVGKIHHLDCRV